MRLDARDAGEVVIPSSYGHGFPQSCGHEFLVLDCPECEAAVKRRHDEIAAENDRAAHADLRTQFALAIAGPAIAAPGFPIQPKRDGQLAEVAAKAVFDFADALASEDARRRAGST